MVCVVPEVIFTEDQLDGLLQGYLAKFANAHQREYLLPHVYFNLGRLSIAVNYDSYRYDLECAGAHSDMGVRFKEFEALCNKAFGLNKNRVYADFMRYD